MFKDMILNKFIKKSYIYKNIFLYKEHKKKINFLYLMIFIN